MGQSTRAASNLRWAITKTVLLQSCLSVTLFLRVRTWVTSNQANMLEQRQKQLLKRYHNYVFSMTRQE